MTNYEEREINPAREWFKNGGGEDWIKKYIANSEWILANYDQKFTGIYKITLNNITSYIGATNRLPNRLIEHAHNLANRPEPYFGVLENEIKENIVQINLECIECGIYGSDLKLKEEKYIMELKPFLQEKTPNSDRTDKSKEIDKCAYYKGNRRKIAKSKLNLN